VEETNTGVFEVGQKYQNRIGRYTVLELNGPKMRVQYEDGEKADLNIEIQRRIWENIVAEEEAKQSRSARIARRLGGMDTRHFIRPITILAAEDLTVSGGQERALVKDGGQELRPGDRIIYLTSENQLLFAVATVTGWPTEPTARDLLLEKQGGAPVRLYPIDLDAHAINLDNAIPLDSVELENQAEIRQLLNQIGIYIPISEDEFELIAEMLTEVTEDEEEDEEEEEEEEED
jgi:hypothetical protein